MKTKSKFFITTAIFLLFVNQLFAYRPEIKYKDIKTTYSETLDFTEEGTTIVITPKHQTETALIFYPGGFVSRKAYLPLVAKVAEKSGITCFVMRMPSKLAVLNINAAEKCLKSHPEIKNWYISGHSLGGAMAGTYASENSQKIKGIIFLAAYSTSNLCDSGLRILSIYGSNDGVLNLEKYNKYKANLPDSYKEYVIEGGNHCNFGNYGFQKGDNPAKISSAKQQETASDLICNFILGN